MSIAADRDSVRRQRIEAVLSDARHGHVSFDTLVNRVYEREYTGETDPVSHRRRVANALYYVHLPRLSELDAIDYDPIEGHVSDSSGR
ncbi:DUF7344 domain-containing protein [Halogranum amylolyticum]|uniref:DUF7344 domain-containing protein n=1 Tax=Halogranum amylolyticum TaxID=660520 RepID=UPI001114F74D|nr:hypothetical protein [Halogranum amylolyticum]